MELLHVKYTEFLRELEEQAVKTRVNVIQHLMGLVSTYENGVKFLKPVIRNNDQFEVKIHTIRPEGQLLGTVSAYDSLTGALKDPVEGNGLSVLDLDPESLVSVLGQIERNEFIIL